MESNQELIQRSEVGQAEAWCSVEADRREELSIDMRQAKREARVSTSEPLTDLISLTRDAAVPVIRGYITSGYLHRSRPLLEVLVAD